MYWGSAPVSMFANIPMRHIGPALISFMNNAPESIYFPLATFETPLWPSVGRGAKVSQKINGIKILIKHECMTRSICVQAKTAYDALNISQAIEIDQKLQVVVRQTSRYAELQNIHTEIVGNLIYIRFAFFTGNASGHNMATKASEALLNYLTTHYNLDYVSISGNYCTDKKVSAVNGILGRGKYCIAEAIIPHAICKELLRTTPESINALNIKKNLVGSTLAGSIRSANAHYANMLLAFYLATGQDAANIVEGSQGMTYTELIFNHETGKNDLYFTVNIPNIIVGTVGNGKDFSFVRENLAQLNCLDDANRLAMIIAGCIWCGELSLLAAQTNPSELMKSHILYERRK